MFNRLLDWLRGARDPRDSRWTVMQWFHAAHPRTLFLKTLPSGARVLDMGAGDGGLWSLNRLPSPPRPDIKFYAYSLEKGALFDHYDSWELGDWEQAKPKFDGLQFDAIFCCHFIEHISDPVGFLDWCAARLSSNGRLYLEWPSPYARKTPALPEMHAAGAVNLIVSNYADDHTHKSDPPDRQHLAQHLHGKGFVIELSGYVHLPYFEELILRNFSVVADADSAYPMTAAFWSSTLWAQYLVASRFVERDWKQVFTRR